MPFRFKRRESIAAGIRRLARERLRHARACLVRPEEPETIHRARMDLKKVRAILRLARRGGDRGGVRKATGPLREAARLLAPMRDAEVQVGTLENLFSAVKTGHRFDALQSRARQELMRQTARFRSEGTAQQVRRLLRHAQDEIGGLKLRRKGWRLVRRGLEANYTCCRQASESLSPASPTPLFHGWRKDVKDLWYYVRLLRPMDPRRLRGAADTLKALGELLGQDHDLAVLRQELGSRPHGRDPSNVAGALEKLIERRQHELRAEALSLGRRFFAVHPAKFCQRLERAWRRWRAG